MSRNSASSDVNEGAFPPWSSAIRNLVRSFSKSSCTDVSVVEGSLDASYFRSTESEDIEYDEAMTSHDGYYSLSPVSSPEVPRSRSRCCLSETSIDITKPEYFSLSKHNGELSCHNNRKQREVDRDKEALQRSCSDSDFLRDGYCQCSFCNHDDIFLSTVTELEAYAPPARVKRKRTNSVEMMDHSPPWIKERSLSEINEAYKDTAFYKAVSALVETCQSESIKEDQVTCL